MVVGCMGMVGVVVVGIIVGIVVVGGLKFAKPLASGN